MTAKKNSPAAVAAASEAVGIRLPGCSDHTSLRTIRQHLTAATRARLRWLHAAQLLADASDATAARRELRTLRLFARELALAAAAASADGRAS